MIPRPLIRVSIPGEWADGWLYKDHLFLWTASGELVQSPVERVIEELRREHGAEVGLAAQVSLFRNDWKSNGQMAAFAQSPHIRGALREIADSAASMGTLRVSMSAFEPVDVEPVPGFLLAVSIYGNHAFIASSDGLFETNLNPKYLRGDLELLPRLDVPVHAVETNYGAVAASAFEEGLLFDRIDFGDRASWLGGGPLDRVAEYSRSVSMASRDLLNFTDESIPDLYVAEAVHERQSRRSRYPSWQVTSYHRSSVELSELTARSLGVSDEHLRTGTIRLMANSKQRLLYNVDGRLRLLRLKTLKDIRLEPAGELNVRLDDVTSKGPTDVTALPLGDGFLLEAQDRVVWINAAGVVDVADVALVNVRTFPNSRHFYDTALAVEEERAVLVGFLDFPRR